MASDAGEKTVLMPYLGSMSTTMVDLYVGPSKVHFRVHEALLCEKIPYFHKMFKGGFQEAQNKSATFPEDDALAFDVLIEWVYKEKLRALDNPDFKKGNVSMWSPVVVYILADKFCLSPLMDEVMTSWIRWLQRTGTIPAIREWEQAYTLAPEGSPLRKFVCSAMQWVLVRRSNEQGVAAWPTQDIVKLLTEQPDLLSDYLQATRAFGDGKCLKHPFNQIPVCTYHHHAGGAPCAFKEAQWD